MDNHGSRPKRNNASSAVGVLTSDTLHRWSYSSLSQILRCALQFRFQRLDKIEPEFVAQPLVFGNALHLAASWMYRLMRDGVQVKSNEIRDIFSETLPKLVKEAERVRFDEGQDVDSLIRQGSKMVDVMVENQTDTERILDVDVAFEVPLMSSHGEVLDKPLVGELDLLVARGVGNRITVRDLKTAARRYDAMKLRHDLQPSVYLYALSQTHPAEAPADFQWEVILKTKEPKVVRYDTERTQDDFARLFKLAQTADRLIESGSFLPNKSSFVCAGCAFQSACDKWHRHPE